MKRAVLLVCTLMLLTSCGQSAEQDPVDTLADNWQKTCQALPNSESCHQAADKVRDQGSVYGYSIGNDEFRSKISFSISDKCAAKNPPKDCSTELLARNTLGFEGLICVSDSPAGSIYFTKILIRNISTGALSLRLNATLVDTEGNSYEPNVSQGMSFNYLPLDFTRQFAQKLNPDQAEYWYVGFKVAGKLDGYSKIYLNREGPSGSETIFLVPIEDKEADSQTYEEAWYTNVQYERTEKTSWSPRFNRKIS